MIYDTPFNSAGMAESYPPYQSYHNVKYGNHAATTLQKNAFHNKAHVSFHLSFNKDKGVTMGGRSMQNVPRPLLIACSFTPCT